jgi:hypothetical protein
MRWVWQHATGATVAILLFYLLALFKAPVPIEHFTREYNTLHVIPGEIVQVVSYVQRTDECYSTAVRTWIDEGGNTIHLDMFEVGELPAGIEEYRREVQIPTNANTGVLRMRVKSVFYCNWLQRMLNMGSTLVLPDVLFHVSRKDP